MQISNEQFEDLKKTYEAAIKNCESDLEAAHELMKAYMREYLMLSDLLGRYQRCLNELVDNSGNDDEEDREDD